MATPANQLPVSQISYQDRMARARVREREAHRLRKKGYTIGKIAKELGVWPRTVETYLMRPEPRPLLKTKKQ